MIEQFASDAVTEINVHKMRSALIQNFKNTDSRGGTYVFMYTYLCVCTYLFMRVCTYLYVRIFVSLCTHVVYMVYEHYSAHERLRMYVHILLGQNKMSENAHKFKVELKE